MVNVLNAQKLVTFSCGGGPKCKTYPQVSDLLFVPEVDMTSVRSAKAFRRGELDGFAS